MNVSLPTLALTFCVLFGRVGYWTQILEALAGYARAAPPSSSFSLLLGCQLWWLSAFSVVSGAFSLWHQFLWLCHMIKKISPMQPSNQLSLK